MNKRLDLLDLVALGGLTLACFELYQISATVLWAFVGVIMLLVGVFAGGSKR